MRKTLISALAFCGIIGLASVSTTPSFAKTAAECNADYAANKATIKASGQTKKDYVAACRSGSATTPAAAPAAPAAAPAATTTAAGGKSAKDCNAEYSANKSGH